MRNLILFSILVVLLASCKSTPIYRETRIVDTVLKVQPPAINETLVAIVHDTVITADKVRGNDTIIKIRYYPKTNVLTVYALPDTVRITKRDTTTVFKEGAADSRLPQWMFWLVYLSLAAAFIWFLKNRHKI